MWKFPPNLDKKVKILRVFFFSRPINKEYHIIMNTFRPIYLAGFETGKAYLKASSITALQGKSDKHNNIKKLFVPSRSVVLKTSLVRFQTRQWTQRLRS